LFDVLDTTLVVDVDGEGIVEGEEVEGVEVEGEEVEGDDIVEGVGLPSVVSDSMEKHRYIYSTTTINGALRHDIRG
jgi:hypothetical protein